MEEFTDIYRIYTKNYNIDTLEENWETKDIDLLKEKLDKISPLLENGDLIIDILKREIDDGYNFPTFGIVLEHISLALFKIEKRVNKSKQDSIAQAPAKKPSEPELKEEKKKPKVPPEPIPRALEPIIEIDPPEIFTQDKIPSQFSAPFKKILYSYGNAKIYKEVYDHLLETLPDKFSFENVNNSVDNIYREIPKRELTKNTLDTYTGRYIDYMTLNGKIEIDKKSGMFIKIIQKRIIEAPEKLTETEPVVPVEKKEEPAAEKSAEIPSEEEEKLIVPEAWTEEEDKILIENYPTKPPKELKELLPNRTTQAIYARATALKIKKESFHHGGKWSEKEKELLKKHYPNMPTKEIVKKNLPNRTAVAISREAFVLGLKKHKKPPVEPVQPETEKPEPIPETPPEPSEPPKKKTILSKTAKEIYDLAIKHEWPRLGRIILIPRIEQELEYSPNEIGAGLSELIEADLAWQRNPGKIKFKTAR